METYRRYKKYIIRRTYYASSKKSDWNVHSPSDTYLATFYSRQKAREYITKLVNK